jgi:ATP-dependent helicase/nuclease subunit B
MNAVYAALTLPSEKLILTYPSSSYGGGEKRPSYLVRRLASMFDLRTETAEPARYRLSAPSPCFELAAAYIVKPEDTDATAAAAVAVEAICMEDTAAAARLRRLAEAFLRHRGSMTSDGARRLYGHELSMSASRVDKFYGLPVPVFSAVRLNAKPRKRRSLTHVGGDVLHYILENVVRDIRDAGGFQAEGMTDNFCQGAHRKIRFGVCRRRAGGLQRQSSRFQVFVRQTAERHGFLSSWDMVRELRRSDFAPLDFELEFPTGAKSRPTLSATEISA